MDQLFASSTEPTGTASDGANMPLAARMRPQSADEVIGQGHLITAGSALREALLGNSLHPMILYGPPGTGKTTIARLVANAADAAFEERSAVVVGRPEAVAVIERARERLKTNGRKTVFFLDEIHRFNKAQQDALLPAVEDGTIILIGATTENPYFEVNAALLSRCRLYVLEALTETDIRQLLDRALTDERGLDGKVTAQPDALDFLAVRSGGDARTALSALELAAELATHNETPITLEVAEDALQRKAVLYDKQGDRHYDYTSAFIKSMRGSDPDAALYYLAAMLAGGEDARFIARRIIILASEDIGNADPQALPIAVAAAQAVEHVGLPEARLNLAQAVTYMALAPKSNASYKAFNAAAAEIDKHGAQPPPPYLRNPNTPGARELGKGE
ncbi:MAG: replication-associated recombination protein A, partial [Thermoleophilaceae bacterium]|nr:replication-associated recombination protein A [Thermoleophilaceae bacterium]